MRRTIENVQTAWRGPERVLLIADGNSEGNVERMVELSLALKSVDSETFLLAEADRDLSKHLVSVNGEVVLPFNYRQRNKESSVYLEHLDGLLSRFDPELIVYDLNFPRPPYLVPRWPLRFRYAVAVYANARPESFADIVKKSPANVSLFLHLGDAFQQHFAEVSLQAALNAGKVVLIDGLIEPSLKHSDNSFEIASNDMPATDVAIAQGRIAKAAPVEIKSSGAASWGGGLQQVFSLIGAIDAYSTALLELESFIRSLAFRPSFALRIDNVQTESENLAWLLMMIARHNLKASLEVAPHRFSISDKWLDRLDPEGQRLEISQHGYSSTDQPEEGTGCGKGSMPSADSAPTSQTRRLTQTGMEALSKSFPTRFKKGFSSADGRLPSWLPAFWRSLGGEYVSTCGKDICPGATPGVSGLTEVWSWPHERLHTTASIAVSLARSFAVRGYGGLVIDPKCLTSESTRLQLSQLIEVLSKGLCVSRHLSSLAALPAERALVAESRCYKHLSTTDAIDTPSASGYTLK